MENVRGNMISLPKEEPLSLPLSNSPSLPLLSPSLSPQTIKPVMSVGGRAGGEKYLVNNIMFKFAVDTHGMFRGSDYAAAKVCVCVCVCELAMSSMFSILLCLTYPLFSSSPSLSLFPLSSLSLSPSPSHSFFPLSLLLPSLSPSPKVAGHDLTGLIFYQNCNISELSFPLMSLLDFQGFRLIALSVLPIDPLVTIRYGSNDAGKTVYCEEPFGTLMSLASQVLNLKSHFCGRDIQVCVFAWKSFSFSLALSTLLIF